MNKVLFLPTGYQAPKTSNHYMRFEDGENKFRILSAPLLGWEDWTSDKKPVRYRFDQKPAKSIDPKRPVKHFWAMIVWNYNTEEIQVLQVTQASIREAIEALCMDTEWGAPYFYDLKVVKTGESLATKYALNPIPHKPTALHIQQLFNERRCNLEALFSNDDPFSKDHSVYTAGIFNSADVAPSTNHMTPNINMEQAYDLSTLLDDCTPKYKKWVFDYVKKQYNTEDLTDLPADLFPKMYAAAKKNAEENYAKQRAAANPQPEPDFWEGLAQ
jgi:hypothetical protein